MANNNTGGQPFYFGTDEISEIYLGADSISEAYLGEDLVFASGPFMGLIISPTEFVFNSDSLTAELEIQSSESWSITTPAWISASSSTGDSGTTAITLTATAQSASTSGAIVVTTANYSESASAKYAVYEWMWVDSNMDRSVPIMKARFHNLVISDALNVEGAFSEDPNKNVDGVKYWEKDNTWNAQNGWASYHKFNCEIGGKNGTMRNDWTHTDKSDYAMSTYCTEVETNVWEITFEHPVYWGGALRSYLYNNQIVEVYC